MKYIVVLGDGMADEPIEELGGKTPLEYAKTSAMDALAKKSELGMVATIPEGMSPGSDTANLAVLGYNPKEYYTGRSPLEALSIGVKMNDTEIAIRCNLVTLSEDEVPYSERTMLDHSSSEISTEDAAILLNAVKEELENEIFQYYVGTSYRHLTIWKDGKVIALTPPHDILGKKISEYLPMRSNYDEDAKLLQNMMERSYEILNNHPLNVKRAKQGLNKANSIWFWGAGTKPNLVPFLSKFQKKGVMISAVDLLKGIAVGAEMKVVVVEGADGTLHINYEGEARAALKELLYKNQDFVYIHVEAPDEMGHQGNTQAKIEAIERIDEKIVKVITEEMEKSGEDYRMLILPDHPTPIRLRTHTANPVPYLLYDSTKRINKDQVYTEKEASKNHILVKEGYTLIQKLFS